MQKVRRLTGSGRFLLAVLVVLSFLISFKDSAYAAPKPEGKVEMQSSAPVNINKATSEELQTIRGIGPVIAERIIKYRQDHGRFERVEDLNQVNGIGEAKFEKIRNEVTL